MILVTGAAGKTGRAAIRALAAQGKTVRGLVHRAEQHRVVSEAGAQETIAGEMGDRDVLTRCMQGIRAVYHICPNVSPSEIELGTAVIQAALKAGVSHFAYHSVLHPQAEQMPHHWLKMRVEEILLQSGLPFTILQPAAYMQNVLAEKDSIVERGIYRVPYPEKTRLGMVDLDDVAQAAATVLAEPGHIGAIYELVGDDVLTQNEIVDILDQILDRPIELRYVSLGQWKRQASEKGLGQYQIETLAKMFEYYERFGLWGNSNTLAWLLGRQPTSFAEFAATHFRPLVD